MRKVLKWDVQGSLGRARLTDKIEASPGFRGSREAVRINHIPEGKQKTGMENRKQLKTCINSLIIDSFNSEGSC